MILLFTIAFTLRFITWVYPGLGWGRLSIYDVGLYTEYGEAMVKALLAWDIRELASINIGVPPLGTLLVGIFASVFGGLFGDVYRAGLLAPLVASSASVICVYLILKKYSHRAAVAASLLFALDPYLIQCSSAYLDAIGTFFLLIAISLYVHSDDFSIKHVAAAGFFMMLAILTKFTFAVFAAFFVLLLLLTERDYKTTGTIAAFSALSLAFIPWLWFPTTFQEAVFHHTSMNSVLPPIIFGPLLIGVPESYPWYILTYFGLGQVHWNVLPSFSHILLFASLIYLCLKCEFSLDRKLMIFLAASILSVVFIPRNYWTYMWGAGFAKGEGVLFRQFFHYYFYLANISACITTCDLLFGARARENTRCPRGFIFLTSLYGLTAPFVAVMNPFFPYWSFIFTLILNFSRGNQIMGYYGVIAFILTLLMLSAIIAGAVMISRRLGLNGK